MKKFNKKIILITSFSTLITIFFVCALFFFIGKTYSSAPVTTELNGTSIYITGEGVTWDGSKYEVEPGSDIQIQIVNETRLFKSVTINGSSQDSNGDNYGKVINYSVPANATELKISVTSDVPKTSNKGQLFSYPYHIDNDEMLVGLATILSDLSTDSEVSNAFDNFKDGSGSSLKTIYDSKTFADKIVFRNEFSKSYFVLSENLLIDEEDFYGIGSTTYPFAGCFDFNGKHISVNIANEYETVPTSSIIYCGVFGYIQGSGLEPCFINNIELQGKISFSESDGNTNSKTHYVGGVAGYVGENAILGNISSNMTITVENSATNYVGGLFGVLSSPLEDRFDFIYTGNYALTMASTKGENKDVYIGSLAGEIVDTYVYSYTEKSLDTEVIAQSINIASGSCYAGGIAGSVRATNKDVVIKNVEIEVLEGKDINTLIDGDSVNDSLNKKKVTSDIASSGGLFGVLKGNKNIYIDFIEIDNTGLYSIDAHTNDTISKGAVYSGGIAGYVENINSHLLVDVNETYTLFNGDLAVNAIQNGMGQAYAGGLFGLNSMNVDYTETLDANDNLILNKINLNASTNSAEIKAEQTLTSVTDSYTFSQDQGYYDRYGYWISNWVDVTVKYLYYTGVGGFAGQSQTSFNIQGLDFKLYNTNLTAQRLVGSTSVGDLFAGGFIGYVKSDRTENGQISNINLELNNSSVNSLSLSFESSYTTNSNQNTDKHGNNSISGGFIGWIQHYGKAVVNSSTMTNPTWGSGIIDGIKDINVVVNNDGSVNAPQFTTRCIQNGVSGGTDYASEGYVGGMVGFFDSSYASNINIESKLSKALVYFYGTNNPNTAAAGGLIGNCRNDYVYGINGASVNNLHVICKGYSNQNSSEYDAYAGGGIGILAACNDSNRSMATDIHVFNTTVQCIGEDSMSTYAGGVVGGLWWATTNFIVDSDFVNGNVLATSITFNAFAGGVSGYMNRGAILRCSSINSYVKATSQDRLARAAGICSFIQQSHTGDEYVYNNFSQSYVSAESDADSVSQHPSLIAGIGILGAGVGNPNNLTGNYFDLASFDSSTLTTTNSNTIYFFARSDVSKSGSAHANNSTLNSYNYYVVLNETTSGNNITRASSLQINNGDSKYLFTHNSNSGGILNSLINYNSDRFYIQFTGDTHCLESKYKPGEKGYDGTYIKANNNSGLVIASVWFNIYGKKSSDSGFKESDLTEEKGWHQFCAYSIKVNNGRPATNDDTLVIDLYDYDSQNDLITFDYNGTKDNISDDTNVAGYMKTLDENTQYVLVNMGQTGFGENETSHVATSIRINAYVHQSQNNMNYPRYSFYDASGVSNTGTIIGTSQSLWYVPYLDENTDGKNDHLANRIETISTYADSQSKVYSSAFNGRLSVERDIRGYNLVITPNITLSSRTIIVVEYEDNRYHLVEDTLVKNQNKRVIIEFIPNNIYSLNIIPGEDTPYLDSYENADGTMTYVYAAGDTVRFDAFEVRRYKYLSFLASVKYQGVDETGYSHHDTVKPNGSVYIPSDADPGDIIKIKCWLVDNDDNPTYAYIKVLGNIELSSTIVGTVYDSDRKAVQESPFNFTLTPSAGYGLSPITASIVVTYTGNVDENGTTITYDIVDDLKKLYNYTYNYSSDGVTYDSKENTLTFVNDSGINIVYDRNKDKYHVDIPGSLLTSKNYNSTTVSVKSLHVNLTYPIVYQIIFDTGITGDSVEDRYFIYKVQQGTLIDNFFREKVYSDIIEGVKGRRYGFGLHDYYLTDDAMTIPEYGDTFLTMTAPKYNQTGNYYYFISNSSEIRVVQNPITRIWYVDDEMDGTYDGDEDVYDGWREVTGPYFFYARWTYDVALEHPEGVHITSPYLEDNKTDYILGFDEDKITDSNKNPLIPINTNSGLSFKINYDENLYTSCPDYAVYIVTKESVDGARKVGNFYYRDVTNLLVPYTGKENTYTLPQYSQEGESIINGVIYIKIFSENSDFDVSDIGETGIVTNNNSIYGDSIFTLSYSVVYSDVTIDDVAYNNGIPYQYAAISSNDGKGIQFIFTDKNGNPLNLPENTSLRLYRKLNGVALDAGEVVLQSSKNNVYVNEFKDLETGNAMVRATTTLLISEQYYLVVTLPNGHNVDTTLLDCKASVNSDYFESYITHSFEWNGVAEGSIDILNDLKVYRNDLYNFYASDYFNIYNRTEIVHSVTVSPNNASQLLLQFTAPGIEDNIFDFRHSGVYYLWEIEKGSNLDVYADANNTEATFVFENQTHYYYLATASSFYVEGLSGKIRLIETKNLNNPASSVVLYTYPNG